MNEAIVLNTANVKTIVSTVKTAVDQGVGGLLAGACPDLLSSIYATGKNWEIDLGNLSDSYAWAVYVRGVEFARGYYNPDPISIAPKKVRGSYAELDKKVALGDIDASMVASLPEQISGREMADGFLARYKPNAMNAYEVVFVAGMYYASFLEEMGYLDGFLRAKEEMEGKIARVFKSKRTLFYIPKK